MSALAREESKARLNALASISAGACAQVRAHPFEDSLVGVFLEAYSAFHSAHAAHHAAHPGARPDWYARYLIGKS